jgi:hypothetical protein
MTEMGFVMTGREKSIAVVVLGMHRSGTSALTRSLNIVGCALPKNLMPAAYGNDLGHWESDAIVVLNDEMFKAVGSCWADFRLILQDSLDFRPSGEYFSRALSLLEHEYAGAKIFVVKDPRACRLVPFWQKVMAEADFKCKYILPFRNPLEVAQSLSRRDGFDLDFALLLWLRHVLEAECHTRGCDRVVTSFDQLLDGPEGLLARVGNTIGVEWPQSPANMQFELSQFLDSKARHHRAGLAGLIDNQEISPWVRKVAQIFGRWAEQGENSADYALLDEVAQSFDDATPALWALYRRGEQAEARLAQMDCRAAELAAMEQRMTEQADELTWLRNKADTADHLSVEVGKLRVELTEADQTLNTMRKIAEQAFVDRDGERHWLRTKADQVEPLQEAVAALERVVEERATAFAEVQGQHEVSLRDIAALQAALAVLEGDLGIAHGRLDAEMGVSGQLREANEALMAQVAGLQADAEVMRGRLGDLESHLRQRQEEVAQAWSALEASQDARNELEQDLILSAEAVAQAEARAARLAGKLEESEAWVFRLAGERQAYAQETARAERKLAQEMRERKAGEAALRRLEDEFERLRRPPAPAPVADGASEVVSFEKEALFFETLADRDQALNALYDERAQAQAGQASALEQAVQWRDRVSALEAAHVQAAQEQAAKAQVAQEQAAQAMAAQERAASALQDAEQRLAERFAEIAALTRILQMSQHETKLQNEQSDWLIAVNSEVLRRPRWWALLPKSQQRERLYQRLAQSGLFDAAAYLRLHPDVAASGMDPLRHYILHGIKEQRGRG